MITLEQTADSTLIEYQYFLKADGYIDTYSDGFGLGFRVTENPDIDFDFFFL